MQTEYNPAASTDETVAIAPPATPAVAPSPQYGEGYDKALSSERASRKAIEKEKAALLALVAEKDRQLEQTNLTLKEQYEQEKEQYKQSLLTEAQQAIAERDAKLQELNEARLTAEQRAEMMENQRAASRITSEFSETFAPLLTNSKKVDAYMAQIADDLVVDANGQPALIARRDESGHPVELAPISAAIAYFQQMYPEDFKPPAEQKTGGGYRNLANATGGLPSRQDQQPLKLSLAEINANPQAYLANRDRIYAGDFETK
jgi:hypothetical protein